MRLCVCACVYQMNHRVITYVKGVREGIKYGLSSACVRFEVIDKGAKFLRTHIRYLKMYTLCITEYSIVMDTDCKNELESSVTGPILRSSFLY